MLRYIRPWPFPTERTEARAELHQHHNVNLEIGVPKRIHTYQITYCCFNWALSPDPCWTYPLVFAHRLETNMHLYHIDKGTKSFGLWIAQEFFNRGRGCQQVLGKYLKIEFMELKGLQHDALLVLLNIALVRYTCPIMHVYEPGGEACINHLDAHFFLSISNNPLSTYTRQ